MTKIVAELIHSKAFDIVQKMENIVNSGYPDDIKMDLIFSEDFEWLQRNTGFSLKQYPSQLFDNNLPLLLKKIKESVSSLEPKSAVKSSKHLDHHKIALYG